MRLPVLAALLLLPGAVLAQDAADQVRELPQIEAVHRLGWFPSGSRPSDYSYSSLSDPKLPGGGTLVIRAAKGAEAARTAFGTLMRYMPADDWRGKRLRLSGRIKTEDVRWAQMWLRVDGRRGLNRSLEFYNMDDRPIRGSNDWTLYEVVLDVPQQAEAVAFGFFIAGGRGTAWGEDFVLTEVGKDVPVSVMPPY
jgi:hypothetical protein